MSNDDLPNESADNSKTEPVSIPQSCLDGLLATVEKYNTLKVYAAGAALAWKASCYIGGCLAAFFCLSGFMSAPPERFKTALFVYLFVLGFGLLFGAGIYLLSHLVYLFYSSGVSGRARIFAVLILLFCIPAFVYFFFFMLHG